MLVRVLPRAHVVVTVMLELPFAVPFGTNVKFTVAGAAATVSDSARTAFRFTLATLELSCAREAGEKAAASASPPTIIQAFRKFFMTPPFDLKSLRAVSKPSKLLLARPGQSEAAFARTVLLGTGAAML